MYYPKSKKVQLRLEQDKEILQSHFPNASFINDIDFDIFEQHMTHYVIQKLKLKSKDAPIFGVWHRGINLGCRWVQIFTKEQAQEVKASIRKYKTN